MSKFYIFLIGFLIGFFLRPIIEVIGVIFTNAWIAYKKEKGQNKGLKTNNTTVNFRNTNPKIRYKK